MVLTELFTNPVGAVLFLLSIIIAVTVHEFFHAKIADNLGDPTPGMQGRITLDPRSHLDPLGSLLFLLFGFGWGKPVPYDPYNLKNPRRDAAMIALAGPLSNFGMAIMSGVLLHILGQEFAHANIFGAFLSIFISTNLILGVFNFIPIAPLDGFRIVGGLIPEDQADEWYGLERYGFLLLMFVILPFAGGRSILQTFIGPVVSFFLGILIP
jgi:Zn-dependent protease